jgi:membrane protein implicated in regulation of membrane protease activity
VLFLGAAILMVVWGQFFLPATVSPWFFLTFYVVCFSFTIGAILMAFSDLRALRKRTRAEKRALMEETMHDIEREVSRAAAKRSRSAQSIG